MTTTTREEVERRKAPARAVRSARELLGRMLLQRAAELEAEGPKRPGVRSTTRPLADYQARPVEYFEDVLGVELAVHQVPIVESVRDNKRTAVGSGQKIGKSLLMAGLALWFYESFPDARAVMTSTTDRQVNKILWRELRKLIAFSGWCLSCKRSDPNNYRRTIERPCPHSSIVEYEGGLPELARTGIHAPDLREVTGFTAREAEAVAGVSGANLLYLVDEASGVPEQIFTAMRGNMMGGGRMLMCSNPTRTEGSFFEAFDTTRANEAGKPFWKTFQISSIEVAKLGIPGCATLDAIEEARREYGEDSAFYLVRILGKFPVGEQGKLMSLQLIDDAQKRWEDAPTEGRLHIGIDPAGETQTGDESLFAVRRGKKITKLHPKRGLNPQAHLVELLGLLAEEPRQPGDEPPVVVIDRDGETGSRVYAHLAGYIETHEGVFVLVGVRGGLRRSFDKYRLFDTVRDEVWGNMRDWLKAGGAIPADPKLAKELHAPEGKLDEENKTKITPKPKLREALGRSPDRADACCLSVWEKGIPQGDPPATAAPPEIAEPQESRHMGLDPYAGADAWSRRRT